MSTLLRDKVIFITGWTSGIGEATVKAAIREGAKVCFTWRRRERGDEIIREWQSTWTSSSSLLFVESDVTNSEHIKDAVNQCVQAWWRIDGVFANAGKHMVWNVVETTVEERESMFKVDVVGVFLTLKYTIPRLQQAWGGSIVLMGSDQCLIGKGNSSAYGAAKWAIGQLTKSTAIDYAKDNIRVNCICPGTIDTPLARGAMHWFADKHFGGDFEAGKKFLEDAQPMPRLGTSEEVAETVTFMLSDKPWFMTGSLVSIDGGYVAQ